MRRFLLSVLVVLPFLANAQFKNILLDPGNSEKAPYQPVIAINKDDAKNMVAISSFNNVYVSSNSGLSWTKNEINSPLGVGGNPILISDFKGNLHYFHLPGSKLKSNEKALDRIIVQESGDNGKSWNEGSSMMGLDLTKEQVYPQVAVDRKGNWFATWTQFDKYGSDDEGCKSVILLSTSSNGRRWSKPEEVSSEKGDCKDQGNSSTGSFPAVTDDGSKVFIIWAQSQRIFFDRSFDGGKMWLRTDLPISEQPGGSSFSIPGIGKSNGMPQMVCDNTKAGRLSGTLYIVWADQRYGKDDTDLWFIRSTSYGDSWTQPFNINPGKGTHQFLPSITVDSETGYVYMVYYDRRNYNDLQTDVYMSYSTDAGSTFKHLKISETPFTPTEGVAFGDYIGISAHNGIITPIWTRMDNGKTSIWTAVIKHEELEKVK